jgi:hypothetical protein
MGFGSTGGWPKKAAGWQEIGQTFQGSGLPGIIGGAAGGGLGALTGNPILTAILVDLGAQAATELLGSVFGGTSPAEQAAGQMTGIGQQLIPQLQAQAAGQQTAATQAQQRQLQQATTRMQQSYGASARRSGLGAPTLGGGQPTVSRAQQGRFQAAQVGAMGDIMGRSQIAAQQQLGGLYGQGLETQRGIEMEEMAARGRAVSGLSQLMADMQRDTEQLEFDQTLRSYILDLLNALKSNLPAAKTY